MSTLQTIFFIQLVLDSKDNFAKDLTLLIHIPLNLFSFNMFVYIKFCC